MDKHCVSLYFNDVVHLGYVHITLLLLLKPSSVYSSQGYLDLLLISNQLQKEAILCELLRH